MYCYQCHLLKWKCSFRSRADVDGHVDNNHHNDSSTDEEAQRESDEDEVNACPQPTLSKPIQGRVAPSSTAITSDLTELVLRSERKRDPTGCAAGDGGKWHKLSTAGSQILLKTSAKTEVSMKQSTVDVTGVTEKHPAPGKRRCIESVKISQDVAHDPSDNPSLSPEANPVLLLDEVEIVGNKIIQQREY